MGAVNCAVLRNGKFIGENTDGKGFLQSLAEVVDPKGKTIVMFGAGGAARAIGVELALAGAKRIIIVNRDPTRGQTLVDLLNSRTKVKAELTVWSKTYSVPSDADILVNATSIGLFPDVDARLDVDVSSFQEALVVADVIPNPPRTNLIRDAEHRGCRVIDGLGMLVNQGVIGVKYWTGVDVDAAVMRKKLQELF
jgi:shikimate dehydrogenase